MSDSELSLPPQSPSTPNNSTSAVKFTEKEERVLKAVWQCMKSVPEVDLAKLTVAAGFQTQKTCSNTWGVIKKKLMQEAANNGIVLTTPAKPSSNLKKRTAEDISTENGEGGGPEAASKKARKSRAKKSPKVDPEDECEPL